MVPEFKTSLLREKFTLTDPAADPNVTSPIIALSNRMSLSLLDKDGDASETYVIRTQNMHSCTRLAAAITKEFYDHGVIMTRDTPLDWDRLWGDVIMGYEKDWNPDIWATIYYKGRILYKFGKHHPLLDLIEKCDAANEQDYAHSVALAEEAFQKTGKPVKITHDSNIALIISVQEKEARGGVILRGANRKTTFNYTVRPKYENADPVRISLILSVSAAFLEGVQLAFAVGMANRRRALDLIEKFSDEDRKGKRSNERLIRLGNVVETMEQKHTVTYRPDRPDFHQMVRESEEFASKILRSEIEEKLASGEIDVSQWVT